MKSFLVIYHAPAEAMAAMAEATPEQKAAGMKPWMDWKESMGEHMQDLGSPLMGGQRLSPDGGATASSKEVTGYSMIKANDMNHAKELLAGHPHLKWQEGCDIEVHETVSM